MDCSLESARRILSKGPVQAVSWCDSLIPEKSHSSDALQKLLCGPRQRVNRGVQVARNKTAYFRQPKPL
ncbi:hypothetical protein H0H92_002008 [Tricholoma furcatifolium]|nr:hypothetical protein H0H92_002008 [Tricholoma furcatifolium]